MKALLSFLLLLSLHAAYSQRTNEADVEILYTNTVFGETISLHLNKEWFHEIQNPLYAFTTEDKKVQIAVFGTMGDRGTAYADAIRNLKDQGLKWEVMHGSKIIKAWQPNPDDSLNLSYGIPITGKKNVAVLIITMATDLQAEWEPYFDKVAQTLKIVE